MTITLPQTPFPRYSLTGTNSPPSTGAIRWNGDDLTRTGLPAYITPEIGQLAFFFHGNILGNLSNVSLRKSAWETAGPFSQAYPYAGDFYYWARFSLSQTLFISSSSPVFIRSHKNQASVHLNQSGELWQQLAEVTSEIHCRINPQPGAPSYALRIAGTLVYDSGYRRGLLRRALRRKSESYQAFVRSGPPKAYLLPFLLRWALFFTTAGGRLGKRQILAMAWSLNGRPSLKLLRNRSRR